LPDLQVWEDFLTKEKEWEKLDSNKAQVYMAEQIKELQETDHIAHSVIKTQHMKFEITIQKHGAVGSYYIKE
jgi:hypothetical protein